MKNERIFLTRKCPSCDHESVDPGMVFKLPAEIELLASALELPVETVSAMIDRGAISTRRTVDKNGRPYGPLSVLLGDARRALERAAHAGSQH